MSGLGSDASTSLWLSLKDFFYPYLNKLFVQGVIYYYSKAKSFIYKGELKFKQKLFKKV